MLVGQERKAAERLQRGPVMTMFARSERHICGANSRSGDK
jgi:hypothetical protein